MPIKTITELLQRLIPQPRIRDISHITNITCGRGLNRPSDTGRVMESPHGVEREVQPRRKSTIPNALAFESRARTEGKPKTDSQDAKAETLRRHTRRRVPTDRAKSLMNNGSWDVHLRTPSRKRRKPREIRAKRRRNSNVRNSEDAERMSNSITEERSEILKSRN